MYTDLIEITSENRVCFLLRMHKYIHTYIQKLKLSTAYTCFWNWAVQNQKLHIHLNRTMKNEKGGYEREGIRNINQTPDRGESWKWKLE